MEAHAHPDSHGTPVGILNGWGHEFQLAKCALTFLSEDPPSECVDVNISQFDRIPNVQDWAAMFFLGRVEIVSLVPRHAVIERCVHRKFFGDTMMQTSADTKSNNGFSANVFDTQRHVL